LGDAAGSKTWFSDDSEARAISGRSLVLDNDEDTAKHWLVVSADE